MLSFDRVIDSAAALREVIPPPAELVKKKQLPALDAHARDFLARSPFVVIGTAGDVSPRGEAPGGFLVLDDRTIAIGDRPGNRRTDSFLNLLENPKIGLLFLVPGVDETLRVNGRARIVVDAKLFARLAVDGKPPLLALVVDVEEVFFQCAKAFRRSRLWDPKTWPDPALQPPLARVLKDQVPSCELSLDQLDAMIREGYEKRLY
ncbi:MAG TPA: MSMEG_1061 family FMN-dependent PPOX-type flavoprotein [Planctomycetota bacterium]